MRKGGAVYIMANATNTVLYTGVTSQLMKRCYRHKTNYYPGSFSGRYRVYKLVYYERFHSIKDAIAREKQIKAGSRKKKEDLINSMNPEWKDLYYDLNGF
jgi:putative endonuclease